jgi:NADH-quinone oxidoreductase subunit L
MALVNRDLKRIIAYSTLSQLGYMFAAAGLGAYWIALFHLAAHAFFKALLFLGAGNVMHAMHDELDIFKMGGLKKSMKWTYIYMGVASLALAGIPPLAGFFSKDAIIETAFNEGTIILWIILVVTAGMTAFYSFRQVFLTFEGDERYKEFGIHPHEMYKFVLIAMSPLAILAVVAGFFQGGFQTFITQLLPNYEMSEHTHHLAWILGIVVLAFAVGGIALARYKYINGLHRDEKVENSFVYQLLKNQYYIPKFYAEFISKPYAMISSLMWRSIDMKIVDASVDAIANFIYSSGDKTRRIQTGNLSNYLNWMSFGLVALLIMAAISSVIG